MARENRYIKIPTDFFNREQIKAIEKLPDADGTILLYIELLCTAYKKNSLGIFSVANVDLTDDLLSACFDYTNLCVRLDQLEQYGLIKRNQKSIQVFKFWADLHDRGSARYRDWRAAVFKRDSYKCTECGTSKDIQAHHIETWKNCKELRYDVSNGITLCRKCHLAAHGGSWRG